MSWTALLPIAMKLIELILDKSKANAEAKAKWSAFISALREQGLTDARSRYEAENQIDDINSEFDNRNKPNEGGTPT